MEDAISGAETIAAPCLLALAPQACLYVSRWGGDSTQWLASFWYSLNPLFCEWARLCFKAFHGKVLSLSFFPSSLALPRFGLLSHFSSLRSPSGHSVLTLSSAAHASLFSPRLLVMEASIWATSPLEVGVRTVICGFYLFIFSSL